MTDPKVMPSKITTKTVPVRAKPLPLEFPGAHYVDNSEIEAVTRVLKSKSLFRYYGVDLQREVESFEAEFAEFLGAKYCLAVASGTGALHTALSAVGVGPGQEVIVPAYMWVSVVAAVVNRGAIPVVVDIDHTFCLDPAQVEKHISDKTSTIIMVHMSGAPGNMQAIQKIARRHGLYLLEDCAQCIGGSINGQRVGTFGDLATFSFQLNKNITAGEGGCVVTNNLRLYRRAVASHDLGYARDQHGRLILDKPDLCLWGGGYRLDELRAAILRVQLRKLPLIISAMHRSKYRICQTLESFPQIQLRSIPDPEGDTGCFLITTYADKEIARRVNKALRAEGIATFPQGVSNILMTEMGLHIYYNNISLVSRSSVDQSGFPWSLPENAGMVRNYARGACPTADGLFERSILLPIPSCLSNSDEDDIIYAFQKVISCVA